MSAYRAILAMVVLFASVAVNAATYPFGLSAPSTVPVTENFQATVTEFDIPSTNVGSYSAAYTTTISNPSSNTSTYYLWLVSEDPNTGKVELEATTTTAGKGLKKSSGSTIEHLETTSNINALAPGQSMTLSIKVKPTAAGTWTGWIVVGENSGKDVYIAYRIVGTTPPAAPAPAPPPPIKPFVRILFDQPDLSGATARVPAHLIWGGDSPTLVLNPDYSKIIWKKNGSQVATGKDPWLELANGDTVTVSATSISGVVYTSTPEVFRVATPPSVSVFDPGDSGYHPKPKLRETSQSSDLVKTKERVGSRRGKPVAVESVTWGEAKNREW